jgi:hypothetical protein
VPRAHGQDLSKHCQVIGWREAVPRAHGQDLSKHCQVIGWREAVPRAHGQDLSTALPGHRVERSCAAGAWPGSLKSTARS